MKKYAQIIKIGYIRLPTIEQKKIRQLENINIDKNLIDKCSGKTKDRTMLKELLEFVKESDIIVVPSINNLFSFYITVAGGIKCQKVQLYMAKIFVS